MSMEVVAGKFSREFVQLDLKAVVFDIIDEVKVVYGLYDSEIIVHDVHSVVFFAYNVRNLDLVDSFLDNCPIGFFYVLDDLSVCRKVNTIFSRVCCGNRDREHASKQECSKHLLSSSFNI